MTDKKGRIKRRKRKIKIAHVVPATPHMCGMYETAHELVAAERQLGLNAHIVDPRPSPGEGKSLTPIPQNVMKTKCPRCKEEITIAQKPNNLPMVAPPAWSSDRDVCIAPISFAEESDVIVSHSGCDKQFDKCKALRIHLAHGRPNSSYRIERDGETPILDTYHKMMKDERWKTMITLWPGFDDYWRLYFPRDVRVFNAFVDLNYWKIVDSTYDFHGRGGQPNIVVADIWRKDKDPFHVVHAMVIFAEKYPEARIHFYGVDGTNHKGRNTIFDCIKERGILGEIMPLVSNLREIYNASDMLITPHKMATRTVREALACGMQVVAGLGNPFTVYNADEENLRDFANQMEKAWNEWQENKKSCRGRNRQIAELNFDVMKTAQQFKDLFEELLKAG